MKIGPEYYQGVVDDCIASSTSNSGDPCDIMPSCHAAFVYICNALFWRCKDGATDRDGVCAYHGDGWKVRVYPINEKPAGNEPAGEQEG